MTQKPPRTTASLLVRMCVFMGVIGITTALLRPAMSSLNPMDHIPHHPLLWGLGGAILGLIVHLIMPRK